jgi:Peptidase C13 family
MPYQDAPRRVTHPLPKDSCDTSNEDNGEEKSMKTTYARAAWVAGLFFCAVIPAQAQQMHYLGVAASDRQTVFNTEVAGAGTTLGSAWQLASSSTVTSSLFSKVTYPRIAEAIRAAGDKMDKERDVLFLLVSSHGAPGGRGIELSGGGLMTAGQLRSALDGAGIKNRVVVISACYSGQFVRPLASPTTLVITAANSTNPSFGCSNTRAYTYFGDAFFNYGMTQRGRDLRGAYTVARTNVTAWERKDGERPSQPQMSTGARMGAVLKGLK